MIHAVAALVPVLLTHRAVAGVGRFGTVSGCASPNRNWKIKENPKMNREIELTPQGGRYYPAMAFHWAIVVLLIVPVTAILIVAVLNPFWFRNAMFEWVERRVNQLSRWRNYQKYRIYLGCDPRMWHTLKGDFQ